MSIHLKNKKRSKRKKLYLLSMFFFGVYISFKYIDKNFVMIEDKEFVNIMMSENKEYNLLKTILKRNFTKKIESLMPVAKEENNLTANQKSPVIYIYNSHQTEEYAYSNFTEFSINPTVMMADYILENIFNASNHQTIVEERRIKDVLNQNNWKYYNSYKASRIFLEDAIINNNSLKYFIDVHRDSLPKQKTTTTINNKDYAKIIFLIGLENENYQQNLAFTEKLNNKINEKYPTLSKGIYKKGGPGVNGIYNQDFSPYTILIEIGGYENNTTEVLNTTLAFAECFLEVINTNEG